MEGKYMNKFLSSKNCECQKIMNCLCGMNIIGATGPTGPTGPQGEIRPTGPSGTDGVLSYADFYALMPPDNVATVAPGTEPVSAHLIIIKIA